MKKFLSLNALAAVALSSMMTLTPTVSEAARTAANPHQWSESDLAKIPGQAAATIRAARDGGGGCLAWDRVWEDAASALSAYFMFGTDNFCGPKVELNRSEGEKIYSPSGMPSDSQCRQASGVSNLSAFVRYRHVEKWRMTRRGQTNNVMCSVHYVILD